MQRRDGVRLTEAERPQHGRVGLRTVVVHLVRDEDDGFLRAAQQLDDGLVGVGGADRGVDHEHHGVGEFDRDLGLFGDAQVDAARVDLPPAGVDEGEPASDPLGVVRDAVTRHTRHVLDDGLTAPQDAVDERRLADVGTTDDGDDGPQVCLAVAAVLVDLTGQQRTVLVAQVEVLEPDAQRLLDRLVRGGRIVAQVVVLGSLVVLVVGEVLVVAHADYLRSWSIPPDPAGSEALPRHVTTRRLAP